MQIVEAELAAYGEGLEDKARIVALNKVDLADRELVSAYAAELREAGAQAVYPISAATGAGIDQLMDAVLGYLPHRTSTENPGQSTVEADPDAEQEDPSWDPLR